MNVLLKKVASVYLGVFGVVFVTPIINLTGIGLWSYPMDIFMLWVMVAVFLGVIISVGFLCIKKHRRTARYYFLAFIFSGVMAVPSFMLVGEIRSFGFYLAGLRAEPLVLAVENYVAENGDVPKNIEGLVPQYIENIPYGIPRMRILERSKSDGQWGVAADVSTGMMNWDEFIYRSDQDYSAYGGAAEKIGAWIYYHE